MNLAGKKHINSRLNYIILLVQLFALSSKLCEANIENNDIQPVPMWLHGSEPDRQPDDQVDKLTRLLDRVGPNIRASSEFHDYADQTVEDSLIAWQAMENQTQRYAQGQVDYYRPKIGSLLSSANVTSNCREATNLTLNAIRRLDSWAIQLWNSMGSFPPTGFLDGEWSNLGSYYGCVDLAVPDTRINHTSYCMLSFRPIIQSRRAFHMVFQKEHERLLDLFNRNHVFNTLANQAQYFHYLYLRTAVCVPSQCSPEDMQQVAQLIGRHWFLTTGPVKCFTRAPVPVSRKPSKLERLVFDEIENEPVWASVGSVRQLNYIQRISLLLIVAFYALVAAASIWHGLENVKDNFRPLTYKVVKQQAETVKNSAQPIEMDGLGQCQKSVGWVKHCAFEYFSVITNGREFFDTRWKSNEITCLHGLRVLTMIWIIIVHCLQYNEWSGFTRIFENEATLKNPLLHPIYNANYVVDNFFFMSGLLASFSSWTLGKKVAGSHTVRMVANIINRYLRLTPQVLLISLLYTLLPLVAHGPFWFDMTEHSAKYCEKNWWVNLLHLQAFYREDEICNLVGWWISVDMLFYLTAIAITHLVLVGRRTLALHCTTIWVACCTIVAASKHYSSAYPPNNLGTIPQVSEVWTRYVVNYFWSPFTHAYPFYLGLWVGYVLAKNKWRQQVETWSRSGTIISAILLVSINMSSHIWMSGAIEIGSQWISTLYNCLCPILWINGLAWFVIACHYGCMPTLNKLLSIKLFVLLSKASFIIYLSHMLVLRFFFGTQVTLFHVAPLTLSSIVLNNVVLSTLFGVFLCITFEGPSMKFQKTVAKYIKSIGQDKEKRQTIDMPENNLKEVKN